MRSYGLVKPTLLGLCLSFSQFSFANTSIKDTSIKSQLNLARQAESLMEFDQHLNLGLNTLISNAQAQSTDSSQALEHLCSQLDHIATEDLALMDSEINDLFESLPETCLAKPAARLNAYWMVQKMNAPAFLFKRSSRAIRTVEMSILQRQNRILNGLDLPPKHIMLTFDDGPKAGTTDAVLDALREYDAKAVFFSLGRNARNNQAVAKRIVDEGHVLASHTHNHPSLHRFIGRSFTDISVKSGHCFAPISCSRTENGKSFDPRADRIWSLQDSLDEIRRGHIEVFRSAGMVWPFFRPPYGDDFSSNSSNAPIRDFLNKNEFWNFRWNMDSHDYKFTDRAQLVQNVINVIKTNNHRGILLFHDIKRVVPLALPEILKYLADNDYTLVIPEQLPEDMLFEKGTLIRDEPHLAPLRREPRLADRYDL